MAFQGRFAALTMATDVTERRRVEHRNTIFSKLSHRLSSATTASEAAMIICEAADALVQMGRFCAGPVFCGNATRFFPCSTSPRSKGSAWKFPRRSSPRPPTRSSVALSVAARNCSRQTRRKDHSACHDARARSSRARKSSAFCSSKTIRPVPTRERDLEMLQTLADQCGGALERVRAEDELRQTEQRFRDLFENSPDAIFVEDLDGTRAGRESCRLRAARSDAGTVDREKFPGRSVPSARRERPARIFKNWRVAN